MFPEALLVTLAPISNPRPYEIHEGEQEALGDWSLMKVGERYYAFGDYERETENGTLINSGILYGDSLYDNFEIVGSVGEGHPDPTTGFAEGQFYLITQRNTDFISSGPWVDGVEARAGVDTDNDGDIDLWTDWQDLTETKLETIITMVFLILLNLLLVKILCHNFKKTEH